MPPKGTKQRYIHLGHTERKFRQEKENQVEATHLTARTMEPVKKVISRIRSLERASVVPTRAETASSASFWGKGSGLERPRPSTEPPNINTSRRGQVSACITARRKSVSQLHHSQAEPIAKGNSSLHFHTIKGFLGCGNVCLPDATFHATVKL